MGHYYRHLLLLLLHVILGAQTAFGSHGYNITSFSLSKHGFTSYLSLSKSDSKYNQYGADITDLKLEATHLSENVLRVRITDAHNKRWEIPQDLIIPSKNNLLFPKKNGVYQTNELAFNYSINPFGFSVTRSSNGDMLFDSGFGDLVFKDQYLQISTRLPLDNSSLYGLGESTRPGFKLIANDTYTLWNADTASLNTYLNLYGSHPFYLDVRHGGVSHGVLLYNSNGMDIEYGGSSLTYKVIGGVLDFYFFSGPSPLDVIQQYTELVGRPAPMPYWSFGFHHCRYGFKNVEDLETVTKRYAEVEIPLEVMWTDIDYMDAYKDFTLHPVNFPEDKLRSFVDTLHANGQKYVMIVDPGISINKSYEAFNRGLEEGIFVKQQDGSPYMGQVWPGPVHFPDFLNPKTQSYWTNEINLFHKKIPFDGLWIDMNEASNFCTGVTCSIKGKCPTQAQTQCCLACSDALTTKWDFPPYKINNSGVHRPINDKTIAASSLHYGGIVEYNAHNLYGLTEAMMTNKALKETIKKRPFVLSRSTFVGSGKHTAHWTGDNGATWNDLHYSINTMLNFGVFGVPMVGADICGFAGGTTEELCNRWIQLGSFYPFSRAHSEISSIRQELYLWRTVTESAKKALRLRYSILSYIYTLSYFAHVNGTPIARPFFFTFQKDPNVLSIDRQFLVGESVMVSPVLEEGALSVEAYFPRGTWYSLNNFSESVVVEKDHGSYVKLDAPLDTINVHVYQGTILPMQEPSMTTEETKRSPFSLVVAIADKSIAKGELYVDDGEDLEMGITKGKSTFVRFYAEALHNGISVTSVVEEGDYALQQGLIVNKITVLSSNFGILQASDISFPIGKSFKLLLPFSRCTSINCIS